MLVVHNLYTSNAIMADSNFSPCVFIGTSKSIGCLYFAGHYLEQITHMINLNVNL